MMMQTNSLDSGRHDDTQEPLGLIFSSCGDVGEWELGCRDPNVHSTAEWASKNPATCFYCVFNGLRRRPPYSQCIKTFHLH